MEYLSIILNSVFTGFGVAIGTEFHSFFKSRRAKLKEVYARQFRK